MSTQLIKPDYLVILPPTQHHCFFRNLPPFSKELTSRKSNRTVINEVEYCGQNSENSLEAAEIFNTFFSEIGANLSTDVAETAVSYSEFLTETDKLFSFCKTTPTQVYSLLSKLSKSKATGPDNIPAKLLKECPNLICESLSLIFNQSFKVAQNSFQHFPRRRF